MSKRVQILGSMASAGAALVHGDIVDLDDHVAEAWVSEGNARLVGPSTPTTAAWPSSLAIERQQAEAAAAAAAPAETVADGAKADDAPKPADTTTE